MNIRARIMDEHAGLRIAVRIDVEIISAARDASADEFPVILEIHGEDRLSAAAAADLTDSVINIFTLLRIRHQFRCRIHADRHQMEIPAEAHALFDLQIQELITGDRLKVILCVGDRGPEQAAVLLQNIHGMHDSAEHALAAAHVIDLGEPLQRDGEA